MIDITDLGECNNTIKRKVVCFEKKKEHCLVFIIVQGFCVDVGFGTLLQDKLPLYVIPYESIEEHVKLYAETGYEIQIKESNRK